jgi:hypothetical protein
LPPQSTNLLSFNPCILLLNEVSRDTWRFNARPNQPKRRSGQSVWNFDGEIEPAERQSIVASWWALLRNSKTEAGAREIIEGDYSRDQF